MFGRRRSWIARLRRPRTGVSRHVEDASRGFHPCLDLVEKAKSSLAAAAPGGRTLGVPLAEALAAFESALREARLAMPGWRTTEVEEAWLSCARALEESLSRAEALRLGEAPAGYELLYTVLGDLMEPLDAFADAAARFRALARRWTGPRGRR